MGPHTVTKRGCLRFPSAVDVLLWHTAVGLLHQENHMCLLDFELNRNESLLHTVIFLFQLCGRCEGVQGVLTLVFRENAQAFHDDRVVELSGQLEEEG